MKTKLMTLLALSLLAGGTINAQTTATAFADQWAALRLAQGTNFSAALPEAIAIKDGIVAQDAISQREADIVLSVLDATGSREQRNAAILPWVGKSPRLAAVAKTASRDYDGWTPEMFSQGLGWAMWMSSRDAAPQEFRDATWAAFVAAPIIPKEKSHMKFFKSYRATRPKAEQLAVTAQQKELLLAVPTRTAEQNAWLAEVSADLIALQLDQAQ